MIHSDYARTRIGSCLYTPGVLIFYCYCPDAHFPCFTDIKYILCPPKIFCLSGRSDYYSLYEYASTATPESDFCGTGSLAVWRHYLGHCPAVGRCRCVVDLIGGEAVTTLIGLFLMGGLAVLVMSIILGPVVLIWVFTLRKLSASSPRGTHSYRNDRVEK